MKKISITIIIFFLIVLNSCNRSENLRYLSGYWEINSVSKDGNKIKNYPFSGTIDYFTLDDNYTGFRKKVKPRIDGNFDINMHQISFDIEVKKNDIKLIYGKGANFTESIIKIDSANLTITNSDGYLYEYKRFYPKNYLNE